MIRGAGLVPFVRTFEIPKQIQHEKRAGCEIIAVSVLGEHEEPRVAGRIGHEASPIGDRGEKIDKESNHW